MPQLLFSSQSYGRPDYGLPEARLINMFTEVTPAGPTKAARLPRPALTPFVFIGSGPIRGMFQGDGVAGGATFAVSGGQLYRGGSLVGSVAGTTGLARFAGSYDQLGIVSGGSYYIYSGTTLTAIILFKDGVTPLPQFSDIFNIGDRFYLTELGNDTIWFADLSDGTQIDGLSFFTAESAPDANVGAMVLGDEAFFFGGSTVEPWYQTGDANAPMQRSQGRKFEKGCAAQGSIAKGDNALFWVGDDRIVYRTAGVPRRVSTFGVEERLRKCADIGSCSAWFFYIDGHALYLLNIPGQTTFAYDVATSAWSEWSSYGRDAFRGVCAVTVDGVTFVGDDASGQVWVLVQNAYQDGPDPITRLVSGGLLLGSGVVRCNDIMLECVRGQGLESGQGAFPIVQMRYSDDGGQTWSSWRDASLGKRGEFTKKAIWRRLGMMRSPGRAFEWRCTDPINFVASGATINEERP